MEDVVDNVAHDVENSIYITFLGLLDFSGKSELKDLLGDKLRTALEEIEQYHERGPMGKAKEFP